MTYNKKVFNEQVKFLKSLAKKLKLDNYDCLGEYLIHCTDETKIDFLNKQLIKWINDGKLTNWLADEVEEKSINQVENLININYFWDCYCNELNARSRSEYIAVPSNFSDSEVKKLKLMKRHCFGNSICDFHESNDEDDDGSTVFAYTDTRRYM